MHATLSLANINFFEFQDFLYYCGFRKAKSDKNKRKELSKKRKPKVKKAKKKQ